MEYNVGDSVACPECGSVRGRIVWKSEDGEVVGIRCPRSGYFHKKNSVILMSTKEECTS